MSEHLPDVDKLQAKDLLQIAETIEHQPVLGHWPHMRAASDAEAVRRAAGEVARLRLREQQLTEALIKRRERVGHLQRELDTCGLQCSATMKSLLAENERLRTALTGVSTCSTCEACRGAATRALGGEPPACTHPWKHIGISAEGRPFCSQCCVNLVKDPPWRDASPVNPFDKARAVFAGKKGDGFLLKCWFDSQEDLDAAFEALEGLPSTTEATRLEFAPPADEGAK